MDGRQEGSRLRPDMSSDCRRRIQAASQEPERRLPLPERLDPFAGHPGKAARQIAESTKKRDLYYVKSGIAPQFEEPSTSILHSLESMSDWKEVPVENEFTLLGPLQVRKFVRAGP